MNPRTEMSTAEAGGEKRSEFSPMFLRWMISLTIVTLLLAFFGDYIFPSRPMQFTPVPWTMAGGIVIQQGLDLFTGKELQPVPMEAKTGMLIGLLVAFVVGPTLLFFSWRSLATGPKESRLHPALIGFIIGVVFIATNAFGTIAVAIIHPFVAASMREAQALGENRDQVIGGLWRVSMDAYQYKVLPKNLNGGGGSYAGYQVPASLRSIESNEYAAVSVTDTSFSILGSSTQYPGAGIQGTYNRHGQLSGNFKFSGSFE